LADLADATTLTGELSEADPRPGSKFTSALDAAFTGADIRSLHSHVGPTPIQVLLDS
jgi:hypothetical protein